MAFDSALVRNKTDRAAQDSMFAVVDRYVAAFPQTDLAKRALIQKGKRASESQRWDVMAQTFQTYYNDHQFLVEDANTRDARLVLAMATRQVLANGLELLGVSAPERM